MDCYDTTKKGSILAAPYVAGQHGSVPQSDRGDQVIPPRSIASLYANSHRKNLVPGAKDENENEKHQR